jgi:hypothetical protein
MAERRQHPIARRAAVVSFLVLGALATAWVGTRALVPRLGDAMARTAATMAGALLVPPGPATTATDLDPAPADAMNPADGGSYGAAADRSGDPGRAPAAIDIPRERVARLGARQLRGISATDAVDASGRPAGARLHGVGGLGAGLRDGDVVTSIDGRPTTNVSEGTAAALRAYASGEATAHATVRRGARTVRVTVHLPARDVGHERTPHGA